MRIGASTSKQRIAQFYEPFFLHQDGVPLHASTVTLPGRKLMGHPAKHELSNERTLPSLNGNGANIPRRILIVEDNELARRQLQQLLEVDKNLQVDRKSTR